MRKHRLLESMLEFALLASVVGFGLGVLAIFFAASQIFEIHLRSASSPAKQEITAGDSSRVPANGRTSDVVATGPGSDRQAQLAPVSTQPAASQWPLVMVGVLAGLGVFLLGFLAWLQLRSVVAFRPIVPSATSPPTMAEPTY